MTTTKDAPSPLAVPAAGLLAWGQAGQYNAVDDRMVINALYGDANNRCAGTRAGLVVAPTLTAGSGLVVNIGAWTAVVDCGDGTKAVVGTRVTTTIDETASGAARTDVLWADINPDNATHQVSIITEAAMVGRAGVFLGLIIVPASVSTAAAMDLRPASVRQIGYYPISFPNSVINGSTYANAGSTTIPAYDADVGAVYEINLFGNGQQASGTRLALYFKVRLGTTSMVDVIIGSTAFTGALSTFRVKVTGRVACVTTGVSGTWVSQLEVLIAQQDQNISIPNANFVMGCNFDSGNTYTLDTTRDLSLAIQSRWDATAGSPTWTARQSLRGRIT